MMKKLILILFCVPTLASAASASLVVDTGHRAVNTLAATVSIPSGINIEKVEDGNSALLIWVEKPSVDSLAHTMTFAGLTPGGFNGTVSVFSIVGNFSKSDLAKFSFHNVTALANDGSGTPVPVKLSLSTADIAADTEIPEPFTPILSQSPSVFDGQPFLSFLTQDKGGGVERYEYAATRFLSPTSGDWYEIQSPYLVPKSDYSKNLFVRAVDQAGNARISSVAGPRRGIWFTEWVIMFILIACVLYYVLRYRRRVL